MNSEATVPRKFLEKTFLSLYEMDNTKEVIYIPSHFLAEMIYWGMEHFRKDHRFTSSEIMNLIQGLHYTEYKTVIPKISEYTKKINTQENYYLRIARGVDGVLDENEHLSPKEIQLYNLQYSGKRQRIKYNV